MISNDKIQQIANLLLDSVMVKKWQKIVFYANYNEDSFEMKFYVKDNIGEYFDCFSLEPSEINMIFLFNKINTILNEKNREWKIMTMTIEPNGIFQIDYDYNNNYILDIIDDWKKKYLL